MVKLPVPPVVSVAKTALTDTNTQLIRMSEVATVLGYSTLLNPTITPSRTMTAFPSITPLPTATSTFTETPFGFRASLTPEPPTQVIISTREAPDTAEGATDEWSSPTRCSLMSKSPASWAILQPHHQYRVTWTLLNSGTRTWQSEAMFLIFYDGVKLSSTKIAKLPKDVKIGQSITPAITIITPKNPGRYRSVWALRLTNGRIFCTFTIRITVQ